MIIKELKQPVLADKTVAHFCQVVCSVAGGLVMVAGIRKLATLELTEAQLYTALTATMILAGIFIVLAFQCRAWRRSS